MKYLKLIRYKNLLLLAFMQLVFRYGFLKLQGFYLALNDWQYGLLVLATVLIAAAGYVINDIMDQEIDTVNKPNDVIVGKSISESAAFNLYYGLNITGLLLGLYLANTVNKNSFIGIFILGSVLLYLYSADLKKIALLGNFVVAFILGLSVIVVGMFDIIPIIYDGNQRQMTILLYILLDYAVFAFIINFIRELVKDMEDITGDDNQGMRTLPIIIGIKKTSKVVFGLGLLATLVLLWYTNTNLMTFKLYYATIYSLLFVIGPMIFFVVKIWSAQSKKEFHLLSTVLKWIIFCGILSILIITLNIRQNG